MTPDYSQIGLWLAAFGIIFGLYRKVEGWRRDDKIEIVRQVTGAVIGELKREEASRIVGPQPFEVKAAAEFVDKPSFHKHAEINRGEHTRIETELRGDLRRLEHKFDTAKDEILKAGDERAQHLHERLNGMQAGTAHTQGQLAQIVERVSEAARTAQSAAVTAQAALVEAQHKRSA